VNRKLSLKEKLVSVLRRNKSFDSDDEDKSMSDKNDKKAAVAPSTPA